MELNWLIKLILVIVGIIIILYLSIGWFSSGTSIFSNTVNQSIGKILDMNLGLAFIPLIINRKKLKRKKKAVAFRILVLLILALVSLSIAIYFYYSWAKKASNPMENLLDYANKTSSNMSNMFEK